MKFLAFLLTSLFTLTVVAVPVNKLGEPLLKEDSCYSTSDVMEYLRVKEVTDTHYKGILTKDLFKHYRFTIVIPKMNLMLEKFSEVDCETGEILDENLYD